MVRGDRECYGHDKYYFDRLTQTDPNNQTQKINQLLLSIKDTMTDGHMDNTCLKHL